MIESLSGILFWLYIIIINIIVFVILNPPKTWQDITAKKVTLRVFTRVILTAFISDIIIHIIIVLKESYEEVLLWINISLPYVLFLNIIILLVLFLIIKGGYKIKSVRKVRSDF